MNKEDIDKEKLFKLYTVAELAYINHCKKLNIEKEDVFPVDWYSNYDYKYKIEIIMEAIKSNNIIENTIKYMTFNKRVVVYDKK